MKSAPTCDPQAALDHLTATIQTGGQITVGLGRPVGCVAVVANDDHNCPAMLRKR